MELRIRTHGLELSSSQRTSIERRLRFALARFGRVITDVDCLLTDLDGPGGGVDKLCVLRLQPQGVRPIVIEHADAQVQRAVDLAVDHASRAIARGLQRARERGHRRAAS